MEELAATEQLAVLIVDDEENILRAITRLLMDEEFTLLTASSGEEGLAILKGTPNVALIVSDQRMPGMSGAEFLEQARQLMPNAVRMVLTGYADVSAAVDAINKGGAARYLAKPWNDEMLVQAVREGVEHFRLADENRRLTALVKKQNEELQEWNANLKGRVLEQTTKIRQQNEELAERNQRIGSAFQGSILAFSRLFELCSIRLHNHASNVAELSMRVAQELQLSEPEVETIRIAALLHDIGVIGIPETILAKRTSEMSGDEQQIFQQHAVRGQTALDAVEELRAAALLIRHHHEQFNGQGYPDGLSRENIPLGARIIGFADYIDREIGADRGEEAVDSLLERSAVHLGTVLDPALAGPMKKYARYLYFSSATSALPELETEFQPRQLVAGMLVTRDVYSGTGLLLLSKGSILDLQMIESIKRYYRIDPPANGVYAIIARKKP